LFYSIVTKLFEKPRKKGLKDSGLNYWWGKVERKGDEVEG